MFLRVSEVSGAIASLMIFDDNFVVNLMRLI